jgi:hypothetical protein
MKKYLSTRLPAINDVVLVLALTAFVVYGRSIYIFIWKLPSWLKLLTVGEMLIVLSYSFVFSLMETIGIVLVLLIISFILPATWYRNAFTVRSVWVVLVCLGSLLVLFGLFGMLSRDLVITLPLWSAITVGLAGLAVFAAPRLRFMGTAALWLSDRTIVFLYLFIPASAVGLIVAAIRLIFLYTAR